MTCQGPNLVEGTTLVAGDHLLSPNGRYSAVLRADGNLVLYWGRYPDRLLGPMWDLGVGDPGRISPRMTMQANGVLVLSAGGKPYWSSGDAAGTSTFFASIGDDGAFLLRPGTPDAPGKAYWDSGTSTVLAWVKNEGAYVADTALSSGASTGLNAKGTCSRLAMPVASAFPQWLRRSQLVTKATAGETARYDLGAARAQRVQLGGTTQNITFTAKTGHGDF